MVAYLNQSETLLQTHIDPEQFLVNCHKYELMAHLYTFSVTPILPGEMRTGSNNNQSSALTTQQYSVNYNEPIEE